MLENEFIQIIGNFGFPVAITIYLLLRFEKRIDSLNSSIDKLSNIINDLSKRS